MSVLKILSGQLPLLDVRAEGEFARSSIPGSTNLPILNDTERAQVGTAYKQQGAALATELGHQLVSGETRAQRIAAWLDFCRAHPKAILTCWRGGQRSTTAQAWLREAGVDIACVPGGYKALRQRAIRVLEDAAVDDKDWWIIAGKTGTAKTVLIQQLNNSIDLEGLARHRGSAFGAFADPQPTLATFENTLAQAYLNHHHALLVLEDESRTIGSVAVPESWHIRMRQARMVLIEAELDTRVAHIREEYVELALQHTSAAQLAEKYLAALGRIQRRLGGVRYQEVCRLLQAAFAGEADHADWIAYLLENYYDPMYAYQLEHKMPRIAMRGTFSEVQAYLQDLAG